MVDKDRCLLDSRVRGNDKTVDGRVKPGHDMS